MAAATDRAEDGPLGDFCGLQPGSQRHYGARYFTGDDGDDSTTTFLVGLGATNGDAQTLRDLFDVSDVQCHQLRAPESASEAEQQEGAIA